MSEARGRQPQESAEKTTKDTTGRNIALTTGATVAAMGFGAAKIISEEKKEAKRLEDEARRRNEEIKRKYRGGADVRRSGGSYEITPKMSRRRDRSKPFKLL